MKKNIGKTDKIIRISLGVAILSQTVIGLGSLWGLTGLVLIITALIDFCPAYAALGISTRSVKDKLGMS